MCGGLAALLPYPLFTVSFSKGAQRVHLNNTAFTDTWPTHPSRCRIQSDDMHAFALKTDKTEPCWPSTGLSQSEPESKEIAAL